MAAITPGAYGMYDNDVVLHQVVRTLNQSGFDKQDMCIVVSPKHPIAALMRGAKSLIGQTDGGAITAKLIGWLMKFGAVMIPTVTEFVSSPAFHRAMMGRKDSPAVYGNLKALVGLGFSEDDAVRFEQELREWGVLLYVSCPGRGKTTRAVEVLRRTGANETAALETALAMEAAA
jgi:hypothetical protein